MPMARNSPIPGRRLPQRIITFTQVPTTLVLTRLSSNKLRVRLPRLFHTLHQQPRPHWLRAPTPTTRPTCSICHRNSSTSPDQHMSRLIPPHQHLGVRTRLLLLHTRARMAVLLNCNRMTILDDCHTRKWASWFHSSLKHF